MNTRIAAAMSLVGSLLVSGLPTIGHAASDDKLDGYTILKIAEMRNEAKSEEDEVTYMLQDASGGDKRVLKAKAVAAKDDADGDKSILTFSSPANIKGTGFLTVQDKKADATNQWLYLPSFRKTRLIGQAELGDRFLDTDIFFEDMYPRELEDYTHKLLRSEAVDGQDCWVIESIPTAPKVKQESPYGKGTTWVRKDNFVGVKAVMFDKEMTPWKEFHVRKLSNVRGNLWRSDEKLIVDLKRKHQTMVVSSGRKLDVPTPEGTFNKTRLGI